MVETLLLGVDGGGTKTAACLARADASGQWQELGRGLAGPANIRAVGFDRATTEIASAVRAAFAAANRPAQTVAAAVLGLAGVGLARLRDEMLNWGVAAKLGEQIEVVHDAWPVLRAGTTSRSGVALIAGTGCLAFGCDSRGNSTRAGGWGYLFGDEGSGFDIGTRAMRAVTWAEDGRGPRTVLTPLLLALGPCKTVQDVATSIYQSSDPRQQLADLARQVPTAVAQGDPVATEILQEVAQQWRRLVIAVLTRLRWPISQEVELALGGGVFTQGAVATAACEVALHEDCDWKFRPPRLVPFPALGCVEMAAELVARRSQHAP